MDARGDFSAVFAKLQTFTSHSIASQKITTKIFIRVAAVFPVPGGGWGHLGVGRGWEIGGEDVWRQWYTRPFTARPLFRYPPLNSTSPLVEIPAPTPSARRPGSLIASPGPGSELTPIGQKWPIIDTESQQTIGIAGFCFNIQLNFAFLAAAALTSTVNLIQDVLLSFLHTFL